MVIDKKKHSDKPRLNQGSSAGMAEPNKIASCTHFDFQGKNLTPYGGLFPVATMLERLGFEKLVSEILKVKRIPRVMTIYQFILGMVLAIYVGFARLNHLRFVAQDPMLTGILQVKSRLPGQSVFWRFLASLNLNLAGQLLQLQRILRERVWTAANVGLKSITLDTDTTVHTLYGRQMGARKGCRFRFLLLAGGRSLPKSQGAIHPGGAQDLAPAGTTANRQMEALAQD